MVENFRLQRAKNSQKLRPYLSHSKLRKIIQQIDSSRDKKKSLWKQIDFDADFRVFIDIMLKEMGYLDDNN